MWNPHTSIRIRLLSRDTSTTIDVAFFLKRFQALTCWKKTHLPPETNGYRLVHSEADELPGLIVDRYAHTFVFQIHTAGMDRFRSLIIEALTQFGTEEEMSPLLIVERSDPDGRTQEGLRPRQPEIHLGRISESVVFQEYGLQFSADVMKGQKTGFFLDQREARHPVF